MRLVMKKSDGTSCEYRFAEGPIFIGRRNDCQITIPLKTISRKHAVIAYTDDGYWVAEHLSSVNKTYLNDKMIEKEKLKTGDVLRVMDFEIEVDLEDQPKPGKTDEAEETLGLEASLATPPHETVVRRPDAAHAPAMRLPATRLNDFSQALDELGDADELEDLLPKILKIVGRQFTAFHVWCALRERPNGPMTFHSGRRRDGKAVDINEIKLKDKINQVVEKGNSVVLPRVEAKVESKERIRSAMIAAIRSPKGCFGVLYVDNSMAHKHYSLSDLDYLMLLAIFIATRLRNL